MVLEVSKKFSKSIGGRFRQDGEFSGEEFYEDYLKPAFILAKLRNEKLLVDLDGTFGYPTSFLKEAFGSLAHEFGSGFVMSKLEIKSEDEPSLVKYIKDIIRL